MYTSSQQVDLHPTFTFASNNNNNNISTQHLPPDRTSSFFYQVSCKLLSLKTKPQKLGLGTFLVSKTNRKIKSLTGYTGKRYIRELRLWRARHLLETGRYQTVKQVSYAVGFKNQRYFSRIFKDRFGRYPSEYWLFISCQWQQYFCSHSAILHQRIQLKVISPNGRARVEC